MRLGRAEIERRVNGFSVWINSPLCCEPGLQQNGRSCQSGIPVHKLNPHCRKISHVSEVSDSFVSFYCCRCCLGGNVTSSCLLYPNNTHVPVHVLLYPRQSRLRTPKIKPFALAELKVYTHYMFTLDRWLMLQSSLPRGWCRPKARIVI